jgi:hypothetical protein
MEREAMIAKFFADLNDKLGLGDLFWQVATSHYVIIALAALVVVCWVIGHLPFVSKLPTFAPYAILAQNLCIVFLALQAFCVGFRVADGRAEIKRLKDTVAVAATVIKSQTASLNTMLDANEKMQTQRDEAAHRAMTAQEKIDDYEQRIARDPNGACRLTADDLARGVQDD